MVSRGTIVIFCWLTMVFVLGYSSKLNIFKTTNLDIYYFNTLKGDLPNSLMARLDYNKFTFYAKRYLDNFFEGTDINYFFFGGHPREVPGGNNEVKISYWLLPFFLLGLFKQLLVKEMRIISLYGLTLLAVSWFSVDALWWLLAPFWYGVIVYPLRELWKK